MELHGSYSRQAGSPADEIWAIFEIFKACGKSKDSIFRFDQPSYCIILATLMHL